MQRKYALTLVIGVGACAGAFAQNMPLKTASGGELGLQFTNYKYEEQVNGSFFMSNEGRKIGVTGSLTRTLTNNWYITGDLRYASGNVDYTGSGTKSGNSDVLTELRFLAGNDFERGSYLWSPYIGLGVRSLNNDLRGTSSTGASGYRRESFYTYLPIGVTHRFQAGSDARISTSLEYDTLIAGTQNSRLSDVSSGYNDQSNKQRKGYGLRLGMNYETMGWSAGVFYHYWNIDNSDKSTVTYNGVTVATGYEPQNTTNELGVQVKYRFY
jgi:hypothetical protein